MFIPKNGDQDREDEILFVQKALIRRFMGDQQRLYQDFPSFMEHPELQSLLGKYRSLQDDVHATFLRAGFGNPTPEIALNTAPEEVTGALPSEIVLSEDLLADDGAPLIAETEDATLPTTSDATLVEQEQQPVANERVGFPSEMPDDSPSEFPEPEVQPEELPNPELPEEDPEVFPNPELPEEEPWEFPEPKLPEEEPEVPDPVEPVAPDLPDPTIPEEPDFETASPSDHAEPQGLGAADNPSESLDDNAMETEKKPNELPAIPVKLKLPNGKTGNEYHQKIDITPLQRQPDTLIEVIATGFEEIGLTFSSAEGLVIDGTPDEHGQFPVQILLRFAADGDRPAQDYRLLGEIDVLPDPRKLWKEIEPDASLPYPKSHLRSELLPMAGRTMIAASRRGRSHAHSGTFRDDEFELRVNEGQQWYIMAVADGAGSAPFSRRGSQIACERAVAVLENKLDDKLTADLEALAGAWSREQTDLLRGQIRSRIYEALSHAAYAGYKAITEEAEGLGEAPKAFHTTMLLTIVRQFDFGYFVGTWWVGDGAIGILHRSKYLKVMGAPDGGEFAGQTRFLTMPEVWADGATVMKRIEFDVVPDFTAVIAMTDGVSDPKFHTDHNMLQREHWDALWDDMSERVDFLQDNLQADEQLVEWLDFWAAGEHDDRTIAILF